MSVAVSTAKVKSILTRSSGYLKTVASHSLQPYRGCTFGGSLCGVGCYVRHNRFVTGDRKWGSFLEARVNAADAYRAQYAAERDWARRRRGRFAIFLSSSTDPFLPQEDRFGVTRSVLDAMIAQAPDELILQTHTHRIAAHLERCRQLAALCDLRCHISIESDRDRLPGLPPPASPVRKRFEAARALRRAGIRVVVTVSPLLPIGDPGAFFREVAESADAVVIDHFIEGDGSRDGSRTARTALPAAMALVDSASTSLDYRECMVAVAREIMPGRVGVSIEGFAGRFLA